METEDFDGKINVTGSGISLGHPIAATGAMRLVTLVHEMRRRNVRYGLETICGGGGQGICAVVESTRIPPGRETRQTWRESICRRSIHED